MRFAPESREYKKIPGQEGDSFSDGLIASYIIMTRADAYFAAGYMSEYVSDPISNALMRRRFLDLIRRRERDATELDLFQEKLLPEGKKVREVINSGEATFTDLLMIVKSADRFKSWVKGRNPDESLLSEYYKSITQETWLQTLPGKTLRWVTTAGLSAATSLAFSTLEGILIGSGISCIDTFLIDKIIKGWRPDQFVEGSLMHFVEGRK